MLKLKVLSIIFFLCLSITTHGQEKLLTIEQFIDLAQKNDPDFEKIISEKNKIDFLTDQKLPTRQILLNLQSEYGLVTDNTTRNSKFAASLSKKIIESGTTLTLAQTNTKETNDTEKQTAIKIGQSLYKDFLGRDTRFQKDTIGLEMEIIKLQILDNYENYIADISKNYLDFTQSYMHLKLAKEIYKETLKLEKNVFEKRQKNIATTTDVNRIKLQVILKKEDMTNREIDFSAQKEKMKRIMGHDIGEELPQTNIDLTKIFSLDFDKTILNNNTIRSFKIQQLNEQITSNYHQLSKRNNYPDVNLVASYNYNQDKTRATKTSESEGVIGINVAIPFNNTSGNAEISNEFLKYTQAKIDTRRVSKDIEQKFFEYKKKLTELKTILNLSKEKVHIATSILEDENRRYSYGKIGLEKLIEIKNDFSEYRFKYQTDLINLNKSFLDWLNLKDLLLAKKDFP